MKSIIFDWSGVVKDNVKSQLWIVNMIFAKYGSQRLTLDEFKENWKQPHIEFYRKYLSKDYTQEDSDKDYREAISHKDCPESFVFSDMVELIKNFKKNNIFLAVVSSDLNETLFPEIEHYGLERVFNEVVTDIDDKLKSTRKVIENNCLSFAETFFVGDSNHEIDVAKKLGIKSVAVTWGFVSEERLEKNKPDYMVHTTHELEQIILLDK